MDENFVQDINWIEAHILDDGYSYETKDDAITYVFYSKSEKLNVNRFRDKWIMNHPNIWKYANNRFSDSDSLYENLYRMKHKMYERPVCVICGGRVSFNKQTHFAKHCSAKCSAMDENTKSAHRNTCVERYGETSYTKTSEYRDRVREYSLEHYGVEHYTQCDRVKERQKETCLEKYGASSFCETDEFREKRIKTCMEKYGAVNASADKNTLKRRAETCLKKYGTESFLTTEACIEARRIARKNRIGHSGSIHEEIVYKFLVDRFSEVIREYKSAEYPFHCDFYIPSIQLYIEYNGMWTHGGRAYNENSVDDKCKLEEWREKAKTSTYYKRAIDIWIDEDVKKRRHAKYFKLRWIECWSFEDLINKINNLNF